MSEENKKFTSLEAQEMKVYIPVEGSKEEELSLQLISKIPDYNDNFTIKDIIQKILQENKQYDLSKIISAYEFAENAHKGQKRSSGQDYIIHPLTVAYILLEFSMDTDTICAALLHDVVEDTPATLDDLKKHFGQDVALLVDGVTKMSKVPTNTKEQQSAENIRKILIAMYQDIRVILIKLADRLHNMRTLKYRPRYKQVSTAAETINIYVSIAHRLGIRAMKEELEDLAFHYLDPFGYEEVEKLLANRLEERKRLVEAIKSRISERFSTIPFEEPPIIDGRVKSIYSLYKKVMKGKSMDEIYDKYAIRIIVSTIPECYNVLGLIHDMFTPVDNRFKDYISKPKENKYQSLHTTVTGKEGVPFEVQIRTRQMHQIAEYGVAAHWKYKDGVITKNGEDSKLAWIREILEAQQSADDVEEIVRVIKSDLSPEEIVVMTPKGKSIQLPAKSNCIDFAYKVHTEIGHKIISAKVDGRIVPIETELQTGQICEITVTKDPERGPNRSWLNTVKTNEARSKIRAWFKKQCRDDNIAEGRKELEKAFKRSRIDLKESEYAEFLQDDFRRHNCETLDDFYASVGYGGINLTNIIPRLKDKYDRLYSSGIKEEIPDSNSFRTPTLGQGSIILDDISELEKSPAHCCNPLPGDDIVGFITRGHGLKIHTKKCTNYLSAMKRGNPEEIARWREVTWAEGARSSGQSRITVVANDRVGLVYDITAIVTEARMPIVHSSARIMKNGDALFECTVSVSGKEQLEKLLERIKKVKGVISVERT